MGIFSRLPAILFIILAASVAGFAVSVNKIPSAHKLYERHIKEHLEEVEYIFKWFETVYFILPMYVCSPLYFPAMVLHYLAFY